MTNLFLQIYRLLFARRIFFKWNKLIYRCSLCGLGILNFENYAVSGEDRFLEEFLRDRKSGVVFDVGANVGNYAKKVLAINSMVTLYAFEPHPTTYSKLAENLLQPNSHSINAAAGEMEGVMPLYDYEANDGSSHASLYRDVIENIHQSKSVKHNVRVLALGMFARNENIEKIDLLKIDAEGHELSALKGISEYIESGMIEAIHFEFNEMNVSSRTYFRDFWELLPNYDFYRLLPNGMVKIEKYCPVFCEIFAYQNIVALLKRY